MTAGGHWSLVDVDVRSFVAAPNGLRTVYILTTDDELKRLEESDPRMASLERKVLLLGDRLQMLKQTELKLGGLLHSLDVSEDALATEKNLVETMGHALLGPDGAVTDVNQALDPAAIETLKSLRAAVVAKNGATKP